MSELVLTIHLKDGTADGLQTAEIGARPVKVYVNRQADLPNLLKQAELRSLGVYVLIGNDPNRQNRKMIYIGEGNISARLSLHNADPGKAFWDDRTVAIISANVLDKADCRYLESRLVGLAIASGDATVTNGQIPSSQQNLTVTKKAVLEDFLAQIQVLLPVLNIRFFEPPAKLLPPPTLTVQPAGGPNPATPSSQSPPLVLANRTVSAEAAYVNNKFVVRRGAVVNPDAAQALGSSYTALRQQLRQDGRLVDNPQDGKWTLNQDTEFNSPSAAAAVICGFNIAGPTAWKVKNGMQTYGEWLQAQVKAVPGTSATP